MLFRSSDTLWDIAEAEVRSRESRTDEEEAEEDAHFPTQRTVFFMGSKAGVCLPSIHHSRPTSGLLGLVMLKNVCAKTKQLKYFSQHNILHCISVLG